MYLHACAAKKGVRYDQWRRHLDECVCGGGGGGGRGYSYIEFCVLYN